MENPSTAIKMLGLNCSAILSSQKCHILFLGICNKEGERKPREEWDIMIFGLC
jgi:hypothetical protein